MTGPDSGGEALDFAADAYIDTYPELPIPEDSDWDEMVEIDSGHVFWRSRTNPDAVSFDSGRTYCLDSEIDASRGNAAPVHEPGDRP